MIDPLQAAELAADAAYFAAEDAMLAASSAYSRCPRQGVSQVSHHQAALARVAVLLAPHLATKATAKAAARALEALEWGEVERRDGAVWVRSSTEVKTWYRVEAGRCTCTAAAHSKVCVHRFTRRAYLLYEVALWELSQPAPTPRPPSTRATMRALEIHLKQQQHRQPWQALH